MSYTLRKRTPISYEDKLVLPRARRLKEDTKKLYSIEVLDSKDDSFLIHYVGYLKSWIARTIHFLFVMTINTMNGDQKTTLSSLKRKLKMINH